MEYLTLFTIGPVQSFIAQARKLQDLHAGSFLLSYLSKKTMANAQSLGAKVIFPDPALESAPNRFLMISKREDIYALQDFCVILRNYVHDEWENIAKTVLRNVNLKYSDAVKTQIQSLLQIYYASEPYSGGEDYGKCYSNLIKRLGSAKMLRGFTQLDEGSGRKCGLMYEYNALFYREKQENAKPGFVVDEAQIVTAYNIPEQRIDKYIQPGETLSAPAFIKRCLSYAYIEGYDDMFPSVSNVACMAQLNELSSKQPELSDAIKRVSSEPMPLMTQDDNDIESTGSKALIDDYAAVRRAARKQGIVLSPYYAIVIFDGDDMGMWYSAPPIHIKAMTERFQARLSVMLSEFAAKNSRLVVDWKRQKNGAVIYAGGEDFLGAMNIRNVLGALKKLREMFGSIDLNEYTCQKLTFSAGVVLAHVKTPLSDVLNIAREAEHKAKTHPNKDAYCLTVAKHSGEVTDFVQPFYNKDRRVCSLDILDRMVGIIVDEGLSTKFIFQLGMKLGRLIETGSGAIHKEIFLIEAKRLLTHSKYQDESKKPLIITEICSLLESMINDVGTNDMLIFLRAVAFIARERGAA